MFSRRQFFSRLINSAHDVVENNWDDLAFGKPDPHYSNPEEGAQWLDFIVTHWDDLVEAWAPITDAHSQNVLEHILLYRVLSYLHVKLPLNTPEYWALRENLDQYVVERNIDKSWIIPLSKLAIRDLQYVGHQGGLLTIFLLGQYYYNREVRIRPEVGDVVLDAGGCWGDTSIAFADSVGDTGKVYVFEFVKSNVRRATANFDLNPRIRPRLELVERPLGRRSGDVLYYEDRGPATWLFETPPPNSAQATTISIDDFVESRQLDKVDFIKMDIEGGEYAALEGATRTIQRFQPKLAISIYHRPEDLFLIPKLVLALGLNYRLFVDHYLLIDQETVLYAVAG
ncbi:MAG: hypothetical protein QOH88_2288 [Verrucomicrobiota bacterium]|jgi:FkbM family methyltransferase